jgi:hypothetical protein
MIGTISFLKAVKKSQTCHMLTLSKQLYARWTLACYRADLGKQANYNIAPNGGTSVGSVETIIHKHSLFNKVCVLWVPKKSTFNRTA